jgi:hypothetical protein
VKSKRLELLGELLPRAARIAVLVNPSDATHELEMKYVEDPTPLQERWLFPGSKGKRVGKPISSATTVRRGVLPMPVTSAWTS